MQTVVIPTEPSAAPQEPGAIPNRPSTAPEPGPMRGRTPFQLSPASGEDTRAWWALVGLVAPAVVVLSIIVIALFRY
jgi:hypothetical protein